MEKEYNNKRINKSNKTKSVRENNMQNIKENKNNKTKKIKGNNIQNIKENKSSKTKNKKESQMPNKRKKKIWKIILLIMLVILLIAGGVFTYKVYKNGWGLSGMLATVVGHDENTRKNLPEFKILVLGISTDQEEVELTDTIMVASYNPNTQKATLLSIPRDTFTGKNTKKATAYDKINTLYSRNKDPKTVLNAINELTGLNIEYYVIIRNEALIKLVDVIGGVTFNVPIDMDYDDEFQDLHIHLKAGEQILDGAKAEQLVRFRHNNNNTTYPEEYGDNDLGRMRTQREFIMQVLKQTLKPENIFKIGEILDVAKETVTTNVNFDVAKDYVPYAVEFSTENLLTSTLPGTTPDWKQTNNVSIFIVNKEETKELVKELFHDRDIEQDEDEINETSKNTISNEINSNQTTINKDKTSLKIEVLNGSGESKTLQNVVRELKEEGYLVTRTGSTNITTKTTLVNKKNVKETTLKNIKEILGVGRITTSESSSSKVDITIIIGKDYK